MYRDREVAVIIASGGKGSRLGAEVPKQFLKLEDRPILIKTVSAFAAVEEVDYILIVSSKEQRESTIELLEAELTDGEMEKVSVAEGGKTRQKSVFCGLKDLRRTRLDESATVLIHDAARPFVSEELICKVMEATAVREYAIPCTPLKDTIRTKKKTLDRSTMLAVQTPQGFIFHDIYSAHEKAEIKGITATDDAGLMEEVNASSGKTVTPKIVEGEDGNIKITTMEDFKIAAHLEKEKRRELSNNHISEDRGPIRGKEEYQSRIGQGYDVHRLVEGRRLILGGIEIPNEKGLLGHSDADVLTHAIMDAALGAAGLGDIGGMFPDSDGAYKGADSMELLRNVNEAINRRGYVVSNIDATIVAQKPKMAPYIEAMRAYIARILDVERDAVNIKATTTEKLGFEGQELAISAQAVCMLKSFNKER